MIGLAFGIGAALEGLASQSAPGWMLEVLLAGAMLTQRRGFDVAWKIRRAVGGGIIPVRTLRTTSSHSSAWAPTSDKSSPCKETGTEPRS